MTKLSQITASPNPPAYNDQFVGVTAADNDVLFSTEQVMAAPPNVQSGPSYYLALTDFAGTVEMTNSSANTVTIVPWAIVPFPIGTLVTIIQNGVGQTSMVAGPGVTLRAPFGLASQGQYHFITVQQRAIDEWYVWAT